MLGFEALISTIRGLTSAHTKPTKSKEFLNQNFVLEKENFECCEWGENDILHKHLKSSSCPYNLVVGGR